jgi:hypothetical protein
MPLVCQNIEQERSAAYVYARIVLRLVHRLPNAHSRGQMDDRFDFSYEATDEVAVPNVPEHEANGFAGDVGL